MSHVLPSCFVLEHWEHNKLRSMSKLGVYLSGIFTYRM